MTSTATFLCTYDGCDKAFKRKDRLEVHVRTHTGERPYVCHFSGCTSSYARSQHLSRHIDRVHTEGYIESIKERCPHCQLELANGSCLQKHIQSFHNTHTSSKSYKCPEEGCDECFHKKKQLVVHRLTHADHLSLAVRCHKCPHEGCEKTFTFPNKLKRHLKVHQGYTCDKEGCNEILPNWSSLRKHKTVDHAPVHSCRECGAVFKQKSNLQQHIKVHSATAESFPCLRENCGRVFCYRKNLTQHIREFHEGEAIWKNKRSRKLIGPHKKRRSAKKKSFASRLCGVDVRNDVAIEMHQASSNVSQDDQPQTESSTTNKDLTSDNLVTSITCSASGDVNSNCIESPEPMCIHRDTPSMPDEGLNSMVDSVSLSLSQQLLQSVKCPDIICNMEESGAVSGSTVTIVIQDKERSTEEVVVAVVT